MYWEILDDHRKDLLFQLSQALKDTDFYLAGGTGLSLQKGYRKSYDFDFFSKNKFNNELLKERLQSIDTQMYITQDYDGTLDVRLLDVQASFFYHPHAMLEELNQDEELCLNLASVMDIACMKALAIGNRGARKDFFDLYYIIKDENIDEYALLHLLKEKYGDNSNLTYIGYGMQYFDDARSQPLPMCYVDCDWGNIEKFFYEFSGKFIEAIKYCQNKTI